MATRPDGTPGIYDEGYASTTSKDDDDDLDLHTRPVLRSLIEELPATRPDFLVCRSVDRLSRSSLQAEWIKAKLVQAGVTAVQQFPQLTGKPETRKLETPRDLAWLSIESVFATLDKAQLREKMAFGRRERAMSGLPNGGHTPYGYKRPAPKAALTVDEDERLIYETMVSFVLDGHGPAYIARQLVKAGAPTRRADTGSQWTAATVRRILLSEAQRGRMRVTLDGTKVWVDAVGQEAIISDDEWTRVQAALGARSHGMGATNLKRRPLAGILRCSACGKTLKGHTNRKTSRSGKRVSSEHYTCKIYNSGCTRGTSIVEGRALRELAEAIDARLEATAEWVEPQVEDDLAPLREQVEDLTVQRDKLRVALARTEKRYETVPDALLASVAERLNDLQRDLVTVEAALDGARRSLTVASATPSESQIKIEELRDVLAHWLDFADNDKRAVLEAVIDHALVLPPGRDRRLEIHWRDD